jgi:hypothetical protein
VSGELSQSSLARLLLLSIALGFASALCYDVLRIRRKAINIPILPQFEDFLFMIAFGMAMAVIFFLKSSGRFRAFALAGALGGFCLYRKTLGRLVMAASDKIIGLIKLLIRRIILPPLKALEKVVLAALTRLKNVISALFGRIDRLIRQRETKRYIRKFAAAALDGFGDKIPKVKENKGKRKNK